MRFATRAIHSGQIATGELKPVSPPIFPSSTYRWDGIDAEPEMTYSRYQNPNRQALEETVAELEGGRYAVAYASGLGAMAGALNLARHGEQILVASDVYGGTAALGQLLTEQGMNVTTFDALDPDTILLNAQPNARVLVSESPTNPTLRVADIQAVCDEAHQLGLTVVFDNTFATPYLQNPLSLGVDVVIHSATKYLGGHSDVLLGLAVTNDLELSQKLERHAKYAGASAAPFECWLVQRGVKTLPARMRVAQENALLVAEFLAERMAVHYPGLPDHSQHDLAKRQMRGFGAMLAAELPGDVRDFVARLKLFAYAGSLGGVESLVSWPPLLSHANLSPDERLARGIPDNLLRFSIGLEDPEDLIEDLRQALED